MLIDRITLSWFRGAGEEATLEVGGKSVVCYGSNGSGKSSFADALEYLATGGRVGHLSQEYSGKGQISGVRNTHVSSYLAEGDREQASQPRRERTIGARRFPSF